jgi:predicted porin
MKKHLIAAAVAGALAVPAMAQVTISGRIDTAVESLKAQGAAGDKTITRVTDSLFSSNQLVLKGSEDLGGGLKAYFNWLSAFTSDESNTITFGGRGMIVGVSGGFGAFEIGKTPGTMNNSIQGSGYLGNFINLGAKDTRPDNSISYKTPAMGGFTGRVVYGVGTEDAADTSLGKQVEISAEYKAGPLTARVAQASHDKEVGANDATETGVQAIYNMGMAAVNVRYMKLDVDGGIGSDTKRMGVGVSIPLGSGLTAIVDYADFDLDGSTNDYTTTAAGVVKALSKRTNVYAVYASTETKSGARGLNNTIAGLAGKDPSTIAIGVRHKF